MQRRMLYAYCSSLSYTLICTRQGKLISGLNSQFLKVHVLNLRCLVLPYEKHSFLPKKFLGGEESCLFIALVFQPFIQFMFHSLAKAYFRTQPHTRFLKVLVFTDVKNCCLVSKKMTTKLDTRAAQFSYAFVVNDLTIHHTVLIWL